eukprot:jgi/Bigna1/79088/fgenesh1_pg.59_\
MLLFLQIKSELTKQDKESRGPENDEFEQFLKRVHLSKYSQTLRRDGYELLQDLIDMESDEIENYFPKKPHRRRFEKAIKETKQATVVRSSKKPKPVITHNQLNFSPGPSPHQINRDNEEVHQVVE